MPHRKNNQPENGFALLLAITVASVLLALGLTMLTVTTKQLTLSSISRESEIAFQASMAGFECISYHRRADEATFSADNRPSDPVIPSLQCFAGTDVSDPPDYPWSERQNISNTNPNYGYVNAYRYRFDWETAPGVNERCTEIELYLMVNTKTSPGDCNAATPGSCDISFDFGSEYGLEAVGNKDCGYNGICTVVVSRGYNKSCTDVDNGLATVQRELTSEF